MGNPGPAADDAFGFGTAAAAVVGLGVYWWLYWSGTLPLPIVLYLLVALFPVYLVVVAAVLSAWLGYDRDVTDLRPAR
jgi:hypothetical protein